MAEELVVDTTRIVKKEGQLRIWHIPNPPRTPFYQQVVSTEEAKLLLTLLAHYDLYLGDDLVYANTQGLEVLQGGEWIEWTDEDGYDISEIMRREAQ